MKKLLLLALALVMVMSVTAYGQGGAIMLYADPAQSSCAVAGNPSGTVFIYAFHSFTPGTTASAFQIQQNGTGWIHAADLAQNGTLIIGNSNTGGDYAYGVCRQGPFNFLNILYSATATATPCSYMEVVKHPNRDFIEGVDCDDALLMVDGSRLNINDDGTCPIECGRIVPVEDTNWGQIKALYN